MRTLRHGDRFPELSQLHARLEQNGLGIADAERGLFFGESTQAAVRAFQQRRGLVVDGVVGQATWRELVESSWTLGHRTLSLKSPPMSGDDVRDLQARLNGLGFLAGKHDGIFGQQTASAVREFQKDLAIGEDGIVGPETIRALDRLQLVLKPGSGPRVKEREKRRALPSGVAEKRIAIDPGHGGEDPGYVAPLGATEADLTFRLGARVARILEAEGAETILTRGPHEGPSDSQRADRANDFAADLLVSIHLNAHSHEVASGVATYFFEHDGVASEPGEHLADLIRSTLVADDRVDCRSHGRNYPILRETGMPAVVVEPCFITNPEEAKLLLDPEAVGRIASAIAQGVVRYFAEGS